MRKHYIDNLRWMFILLLIPYHAAQAWVVWDEPNYIVHGQSRAICSIIVFFSPFFMPLLFLLAGMSTRFALQKRTYRQYALERVKRLLVPFIFGILTLVPVMTYLADKHHTGYSGCFFEHYLVFFTRWTDLSGADGGFSCGQFWFLLYLFVISFIALGIIALQRRFLPDIKGDLPLPVLILLVAPLPLLSDLLSVGGKSLAEYTYIFLIGYYVFSNESVTDRLARFGELFLIIGIAAAALDVYLFVWSGGSYPKLNTAAKFTAEWSMLLGLIGTGKKRLEFSGRVTRFISARSFPYFSLHFVWVIVMQYLVTDAFAGNVLLLYFVPVVAAFALTAVCCEIFLRVPVLSFLIGAKPLRKT